MPMTLKTVLRQRAAWRVMGKRVVLTNGVFDLLHYGHVSYLEAARALGDALIVALNSDTSVRALKGPLRPLVPQEQRAALLRALRCVDAVVIFREHTAEDVVAAIQPEIYVKGGDYAATPDGPGKHLPEAEVVRSYGGRVEIIPYLPGLSTTELIERITERYQ